MPTVSYLLRWFSSDWKEKFHRKLQNLVQNHANTLSHDLNVPTKISFHGDIFITYWVTRLIWSSQYVVFEAVATFKVAVGSKVQTFVPGHSKKMMFPSFRLGNVPIDWWPQVSSTDQQSHLLQGLRLSAHFLNGLMWYASITNATRYQRNGTILDSQINLTVSYTPPQIQITDRGLLNITIHHGLLLATCTPSNEDNASIVIMFKAEFFNLFGSGILKMDTDTVNHTGFFVQVESLDLSNLKTKPIEPKLPIPEAFGSKLMETAILQLRPELNKYLKKKSIYLPDNLSPIVAYPEVYLNQTTFGFGFAQIISYCTCSDFVGPGSFSKCMNHSVCSIKSNGERKLLAGRLPSEKIKETGNHPPDTKIQLTETESKIASSKNKEYNLDILTGKTYVIHNNFAHNTDEHFLVPNSLPKLSHKHPIYFTHFETSENCSLETQGDNAKTYLLFPIPYCSPIYISSNKTISNQFYVFKPDGSKMRFLCLDKNCTTCIFNLDMREKNKCVKGNMGQSFFVSLAENSVAKVLPTNIDRASFLTLYFDDNKECSNPHSTDPKRVSLLLSVTYQFIEEGCVEMDTGGKISL